MRLTKYQKSAWIILFKIEANGSPRKTLQEAEETFGNVLKAALRLSDVVTHSGPGEFMVLLLETHKNCLHIVTDRISSRWSATDAGQDYELTFESDTI